jgi:LmbE family N-acetylglucosaminyl deacetylase
VPTIETRRDVVGRIRDWKADVVITHRPNDYHPDHRCTSLLVQDSACMATVPFFASASVALDHNPVFRLFCKKEFVRSVGICGSRFRIETSKHCW